ncbi:MAG: YqgE/AlgH family protein [Planctomycetaceae bacterium]
MIHDSLRGRFLIAGKRLKDPNFYKTVVLLVEHGSEGAMGLVVNRPSSITVAHALSEHFDLPATDDVVYLGGPVEPSALFILHDAEFVESDEPPVVPGLYVGSSADAFERVVRSATQAESAANFRIYSGCAGWAPGQLEGELERGDWHVLPACSELTLCSDPYETWDQLLHKVHEAHRILPDTPPHPEWN